MCCSAASGNAEKDENKDAGNNGEQDGIVLTQEQKRRRRARSLAIGLALGALVLLFYVVTIVKLGPGVLRRPL
jgi:hypothetical protein